MNTEQKYQTVTAGPPEPFTLSNVDLKPACKILTNQEGEKKKITGALL